MLLSAAGAAPCAGALILVLLSLALDVLWAGIVGVIAIAAGSRLRWPLWALLLALFAAIPPLFTLPLELWYRKRGLLNSPQLT